MSEQRDDFDLEKDDTHPPHPTQRLPAVTKVDVDGDGATDMVIVDTDDRDIPYGYIALWVIVILSLLLNVLMLRQVLLARQIARQSVSDAVELIGTLRSQTISYNVVVDEELLIDTDMPVNETIPVVIDQTIPIDMVVTVPVDTVLFGTIDLDVPINADIPVYLEQPITIDQTFRITTTVPVFFEVPIEVKIENTPAADLLTDLQDRLRRLEASLSAPLIPIPGVGAAE